MIHSLSFIGMIETRRPSRLEAGEIMQQTTHRMDACWMTIVLMYVLSFMCVLKQTVKITIYNNKDFYT